MTAIATVPARSARRRTPTWLWLLLIVTGLALLAVIPVASWLFQQNLPPFTLVIDGSDVHQVQLGALSFGQRLALVVGLFAAIVAVLVAVPLAVLVVCATVLLGLLLGVGLPLVVFAAVAAVLLSPLLLLAALARWAWRASGPRQAAAPPRGLTSGA
jgi:hypothetical protein